MAWINNIFYDNNRKKNKKSSYSFNDINAININSIVGNLDSISFSVIPKSNDIVALRDLYISIKPEDVQVNTILDTIASANRTSGVGQIPVSS